MTFLLWKISSVTSKHNRKSNYLKVVENVEEEFYSIEISLSEQEIYKKEVPLFITCRMREVEEIAK